MADPPVLLTADQLKTLLDATFGRTDWQGAFRVYHQALVDGLLNLAQTKAPLDGNWYEGAFAAGAGTAGEAPAPGHAYLWLNTTPTPPVLELRDGAGAVIATAATDLEYRAIDELVSDAQAAISEDSTRLAAVFGNGGGVGWGAIAPWLDGKAWRVRLEAMMDTAQAANLELELWYQVFGPDDPVIPVKQRWQASTVYNLGDLRIPTTPNGRHYRMSSGSGGWSDDLCTGGTPLSGGDNGAAPKANAYDNNAGTSWISSQQGAAVSGVAWIGYQLATAQNVRRITLRSTGDARHYVSSAKVQRADDPAGPWTEVTTIAIGFLAEGTLQTFELPDTGSHTCWRLLAQTNTTLYGWLVYEVEMFMPLTTTGTSGAAEPAWPSEIGQSVVDGSVIWQCAGVGMKRTSLVVTPPAEAYQRFTVNDPALRIPAGEANPGDWLHFALSRSKADAHTGSFLLIKALAGPEVEA